MTTIRPSARARDSRTFGSLMTENPMTRDLSIDDIPASSTNTGSAGHDLSTRSITMQLLHEDLARAQIRERLRSTGERRAAQLVRARRLSRKGRESALRARLLRARFS